MEALDWLGHCVTELFGRCEILGYKSSGAPLLSILDLAKELPYWSLRANPDS